MKSTRRKFTPEDCLSILQEAQREGHSVTCRKYNLSPSLLTKWKARYLNKGVSGLQNTYKKVNPQVKELELENERLYQLFLRHFLFAHVNKLNSFKD
jgi:transposase-like protein